MRLLTLTGLFGMAGVLARLGIDLAFKLELPDVFHSAFPFSTFVINILGSFAIGWVFSLGADGHLLSPDTKTAITTGFLGGFTTFSAYSLQTLLMLREGRPWLGALYFVSTPALCLGAVFAGFQFGRD